MLISVIDAKLDKITPDIEQSRSTLESYLLSYLQLLQSAGHHVLYTLPNFSDVGQHPRFNFSQITRTLPDLHAVHDIPIERINSYLSASWMKAVRLARAQNSQPTDRAAVSMAEFRSPKGLPNGSLHFQLKFGAPQVNALCNDEVIIEFILDEVLFYANDDFKR